MKGLQGRMTPYFRALFEGPGAMVEDSEASMSLRSWKKDYQAIKSVAAPILYILHSARSFKPM